MTPNYIHFREEGAFWKRAALQHLGLNGDTMQAQMEGSIIMTAPADKSAPSTAGVPIR